MHSGRMPGAWISFVSGLLGFRVSSDQWHCALQPGFVATKPGAKLSFTIDSAATAQRPNAPEGEAVKTSVTISRLCSYEHMGQAGEHWLCCRSTERCHMTCQMLQMLRSHDVYQPPPAAMAYSPQLRPQGGSPGWRNCKTLNSRGKPKSTSTVDDLAGEPFAVPQRRSAWGLRLQSCGDGQSLGRPHLAAAIFSAQVSDA